MVSKEDVPTFAAWDYVVFALLLSASAAIGVYHAFCGGKQKTTKEFLMADRQMNFIPVAMSMMASFMSAISLMGNPAEIYNYGTEFVVVGISYLCVMPIAAHLYIPIFYNLGLTSVYEYLELRFSKGIRLICSLIFTVQMMLYMAIVLYAPALALNAVTGLNVWISVLSVGLVCIFYTTLGGIKAVMWTDFLQVFIMFGGMILLLVQGTIDLGGPWEVWRMTQEGDRLEFFDMDVDPRIRHTFWTLTIGATFNWVGVYGVNQAQVQRALTCPTLKHAQMALWLNGPLLVLLLVITVGCGMVIYGKYRLCDPLTAGLVQSTDQLVLLYVMETLGHLQGLPGLFVAAIFSGALSTLSSGFNSLAAITLHDIIKGHIKKDITEKQATIAVKVLALSFGVLCVALTYVVSFLGGVLQAALSLFGILGGPILGVFTLGIMYPWANWKGAYAGLLSALAMTLWVGLGAQIVKPITPKKPFSVAGCEEDNVTTTVWDYSTTPYLPDTTTLFDGSTGSADMSAPEDRSPLGGFYSLSYFYYSVLAVVVCCFVGMVVSIITGPTDPKDVDPRLICPIFDKICCCLPMGIREKLYCGVRFDDVVKNKGDSEQNSTSDDLYANDYATDFVNGDAIKNGNSIKNGGTSVIHADEHASTRL